MKRRLILAVLMTGWALGFSSRAAVTFTAGTETVPLGGTVSVPVTVSGFVEVSGFQFTLTWSATELSLDATTPITVSSALSSAGIADFNTQTPGRLTFIWDTGTALPLTDQITVFTMLFLANGPVGTSTQLSFSDTPTVRSVTFDDLTEGTIANGLMITVNGGVTVVPEPVPLALGCFAGILAGTAGVRWWLCRRRVRNARR
jgi:hypothetical protein